MASRKRRFDIAGRQGGQRGGRDFLGGGKGQFGGFGAHCFDLGMALVQRGADGDHQGGDGAGSMSSAARDLGRLACLPAWRGRTWPRFPRW